MTTTAIKNVIEFLDWLPGVRHPDSRVCPGCKDDLQRTALIRLAYVFTPCECSRVEYRHLYEQLWHTACLRGSQV